VVTKRQPIVGDLTFAPRLDDEPGIAVRVPVALGPEATHVLTAVLSVTSFQQLLATLGLPSEWVAGIVDKNGRLIARVPPTEPGSQHRTTIFGTRAPSPRAGIAATRWKGKTPSPPTRPRR
jgi:hypothetical protein